MHYQNLEEAVLDLEKNHELIRIKESIDPHLELAHIHRRVHQSQGPALLFENVKGTPFRCVSNLFGTKKRAYFLFRNTLNKVKDILKYKTDPKSILDFKRSLPLLFFSRHGLPKKKTFSHQWKKIPLSQLPHIVSWPQDGGAFITLPQVFSLDPCSNNLLQSNLGMYRVQISGNEYTPNKTIGLHYQLHRGLGIHHTKAIQHNTPLKVSIFIGGPPSHTLAAVMPLPEGISELHFAGLLNGKRFEYENSEGYILSSQADFCITGTIRLNTLLPEGPFGDHLGYYSLQHPFPVLDIDSVYAKPQGIWPLTIVGRPPQEDSCFGSLIHDLTSNLVPHTLPGVKALHAVDEAGVHPLLLSIGSERYTPYHNTSKPQELLTQAHSILGFGQCSLAKYLFILNGSDVPHLDIHNTQDYFYHLLERINLERDLHFHTKTTIDTLDYCGESLNEGSKLVIASRGPPRRKLFSTLQGELPASILNYSIPSAGILCIQTSHYTTINTERVLISSLCSSLEPLNALEGFPLIVLCDNACFTGSCFSNFLWVTFTRSNPSHDIWGIKETIHNKHWSCERNFMIDARIKPHHAPQLEEDPKIVQNADRLFKKGAILHEWDGFR